MSLTFFPIDCGLLILNTMQTLSRSTFVSPSTNSSATMKRPGMVLSMGKKVPCWYSRIEVCEH
ncbi:hypothetical protein DPMN_042015 [Dreissena polymorpha]|uniref:Uncharacterized protein n=1 Tax=Dreissena polymorpha TaxID=45954 RepID=A0A9D4D184_DREPO|nr:hypothetical protein DPMN_042015 [Dreissena polymorpha]